MNKKHANIIPISFIAGSGGRFVSYLINSAKCTKPVQIQLSEHGNAHDLWNLNIELCTTPFPIPFPVGEHAKFFFNTFHSHFTNFSFKVDPKCRPKSEYEKMNPLPCYGSCHTNDIDGLLWYFDKAIHIAFDADDVHDIAIAFIGKQMIDDRKTYDVKAFNKQYHHYFQYLTESLDSRTVRADLEPNLLNLTWKDIYVNDPTKLIEKLSTFSNIPYEKFKLHDLIEWRLRTKNGIQELIPIINNKNEK